MESQVSVDNEVSTPPEDVFIKGVITSETNLVACNQPVKKQTRQWAAWTRQEEESFFTALRQVGKNFEKITSRVQSKNKDQVRHYYYRLVRRMNKLLGPELSLDAKNSKDTNAAMLRWWSLLEKHSCKASKLHLKPRRFKIFLETLEHQLLKDRKKNIRKRPMQGGNCSTTPSHVVLNQGRASGHDACIKMVLVDSQNIQKLGSGKGSSLRRNTSMGVDRNNCKGDSSPVKPTRQRHRSGTTSTAAYKRWEKAAIAGVSLVADAAEHLERTALDKIVNSVQNTQEKGLDPIAKDMPCVPAFQQNVFSSNSVQPLMKLKLQLFPVDESTRKALEMGNHNPHLELTLSTRKKISSVLEHMNRKWGSSSVASGELTLVPYYTQRSHLMSCQKWTQDSVLSAGDVYAANGSHPIFRLRYGWFAKADSRSAPPQEPLATSADQRISMNAAEVHNVDLTGCPQPPGMSWQRQDTSNGAFSKHLGHMDKESCRSVGMSALQWADSLTNVSVGDLLSQLSHNADANCADPPLRLGSPCHQQISFSCDSFDAAIAAHINEHHGKNAFQPTIVSSIWDAEETCDAFSFPKSFHSEEAQPSKENCRQDPATSSVPSGSVIEKPPEAEEPMDDYPAEGHSMDECQFDGNPEDGCAKDVNTLTDIYWPDSLGPLDLDVPSCRYHTDDLTLSDSLGGFNCLVTSSLDAFQSCSFFGLEKREPASTTAGARETAFSSDYEVDSEV